MAAVNLGPERGQRTGCRVPPHRVWAAQFALRQVPGGVRGLDRVFVRVTHADDGERVGWLPIGDVARRAGVAASALRFYEAEGLIHGGRSPGGRRVYPRHVLRRVAFLRAGQRVGLSLDELRRAMASLPDYRPPTKADWDRLARGPGARRLKHGQALVNAPRPGRPQKGRDVGP